MMENREQEIREREQQLIRLKDEARQIMFCQGLLHPQRQLTALTECLAELEELEAACYQNGEPIPEELPF